MGVRGKALIATAISVAAFGALIFAVPENVIFGGLFAIAVVVLIWAIYMFFRKVLSDDKEDSTSVVYRRPEK